MRAHIVALMLACVATTALTETDAENDDSQVALQATNRALLNEVKAAKATNEAAKVEGAPSGNFASDADMGESAVPTSWQMHSAGHECVEHHGSSIMATFEQCKVHCAGKAFMDWKPRDGRTDGTHYCICSNACTLAANTMYDAYAAIEPCTPHVEFSEAATAWTAPYRKYQLDAALSALDCNPARCDNKPACKIPPCQTMGTGSTKLPAYSTLHNPKKCSFAGCSTSRRASTWSTVQKDSVGVGVFYMAQPGTRKGYTHWGAARPGAVECAPGLVPKAISSTRSVNSEYAGGSWLSPDASICNPLRLTTCAQGTMNHGGGNPYFVGNTEARRSTAVLLKRTWCIKVDDSDYTACVGKSGTGRCPRMKCYNHKSGKCVLFKQDVWYHWQSGPITRSMSHTAYDRYKAGDYLPCTAWGLKTANMVMAGS